MTATTPAPQAVDHDAVVRRYARHVNPALVKLLGVFGYGRVFARARDVWMWDAQGRRYLDFLAAFGSVNLGHSPPALLARVGAFLASEAPNLLHTGPSPAAADLAQAIAVRTGGALSVSLFSCSGAEAVEAGLKLARAATGRRGFVYCEGGYHGLNLGTLSVMGNARLRGPFEPLLEGCTAVPFGDLAALERALKAHKPAAFVLEPVMAEGGVVPAPAGYLAQAQALCRKHGTVLVLDEVQTGLGRTGAMFAFQSEGFAPDVLALGKALGAGLVPISATVTSPELFDRAYGSMERFDLHGSTYAGNGLACATALASLELTESEGLSANARARGEQLVRGLTARLAGHPLVKSVRGRGLLVGIELGATASGWAQKLAAGLYDALSQKVLGQWLAVRLLERGVICQPASQQWNVLKLEPPLTVQAEQVDTVVDTVADLLAEYREVGPLLKDVGARLGTQLRAGWRF